MKILKSLADAQLPPCVATIGFFDGVHLGHQDLIRQVEVVAAEHQLPSLIITFGQHPRRVLRTDYQPEMLNTPKEKLSLLAHCHPDYCCVLDFDTRMAGMTSYEFMDRVLKQQLNVRYLVVGYDHHFGCDMNHGFEQYAEYGKELGIGVIKASQFLLDGKPVSSSAIRFLLQVGDVTQAARLLGRSYSVEGKVVRGQSLGRKLGFPTANLDVHMLHKMLPLDGAYATRVTLGDRQYAGMANIGRRPTVEHEGERTLEVHILNFADDIYDQDLHLDFERRIRAEHRFASYVELTEQLRKDLQRVEQIVVIDSQPPMAD
ncbi:MAG: bifunctional riboflavin kinase/FAD synthetase [Prevotellaceae bacterium]|nr:bifunctional riboflavin kinase/FAD synthetase [Prevotellaceae bacterium]MDY3857092.1 bifunctional riboflavin kinase/FAD synthetase [Bacteroidaceae bacterium]